MSKKYTADWQDNIIVAANVNCAYDGHVYYNGLRVQFPKHLREPGKSYICDLSKVIDEDDDYVIKFYRAIKGTISEQVVETIIRKRRVG